MLYFHLILRGIDKILKSDGNTTSTSAGVSNDAISAAVAAAVSAGGGSNVQALLQRGFLALEDMEWDNANNFFEEALNQNAMSAEAYLGKLMADVHVSAKEDLRNIKMPFDDNKNYQKIVRFGDENLKVELESYINFIKERNENTRKTNIYNEAIGHMNSKEFDEAVQKFKSIIDFKDAKAKIEECKKEISAIMGNIKGDEKKISEVTESLFAGGDKPKDFTDDITESNTIPGFANGQEKNGLVGYTNEAKVFKNCLTVAARGTLGFSVIHTEPFLPIVRLIVAIPNTDKIDLKYFKYAVDQLTFKNTGGTIPQLTVPNFSNYKISVPSLPIQQEIVKQITALEEQITALQNTINESAGKKSEILKKWLE